MLEFFFLNFTNLLLVNVGRDFGISVKLFLHVRSSLSNRFARIKANGLVGDWMESLYGTWYSIRSIAVHYVHA